MISSFEGEDHAVVESVARGMPQQCPPDDTISTAPLVLAHVHQVKVGPTLRSQRCVQASQHAPHVTMATAVVATSGGGDDQCIHCVSGQRCQYDDVDDE